MGQGPTAPWQGGPAWAVAALWHRWACNGPFLYAASSQHGRHRAGAWGQPSRTAGPARCSPLLTFALSSPVCVLCGRDDFDLDIYGRTFNQCGFLVHEFCLMFAHIDFVDYPALGGIVGLPFFTITRKAKQANQKQCCVCGERGAAIACAESGCERSFHLPCAADGECITQFFGEHRSFCWEHRPRQAAGIAPAEDSTCVICQEMVGDRLSYHTLVCPACTQAWFHRVCIQRQASNEGTMRFQCPGCQDKTILCTEMSTLGIQIPARLVSFCQTAQMRRREGWACPGTVSAGLALCCLMSTFLSFSGKLEMELGRMRWGNLGSYAGDTGGSSLSLPSLVEDHPGRTMMQTHRFYRGSCSAMPSRAFTLRAESRQKKRGPGS
ncbi:PHD finger protein 7-like isoform X2 [Numida meleagris]|uniref:PHD finger protein 7-like isoform X2 n=1 Tax=Numida meleagris TaxID=8996 RepID=UPI000B3E2CCD|nr:PHD finger protein 7-like isoform X2 [Numida meleagris]